LATPNLQTKLWLALRAKVETLVLTPALPVLWLSEDVTLPAGNCLEISYQPNRPDRLLLKGSAPHERLGILQLGLLTPYASTSHRETVIREIAGDVADHFVVDEALTYLDITVKVYEAPEVAQTFKDEARQRLVTPIIVRWRCYA